MGKLVADAVLDAALSYIKTNAILLVVCSDTPTTYANATATYDLADVAIDGDDMVIGDGTVSGRKLTISEQAAVTIDHSGTATHIALCSSDTLLYVTTCTSQALTAANTVTVPAWKIEIADPTA
jgi:hypothetical protein